MYKLVFNSGAERYLKKIRDKGLKNEFKNAFINISQNPYIGQMKKGDLAGIYGYDVRYKGINYEVAYTIIEENNRKVIVLLAGTRENFYEQLKRYV